MTIGKTPDGRLSHSYIEGVNAFINFARVVVDSSGNIQCPCIHCGIAIDNLLVLCVFICFIVGLCNLTLIGIIMENLMY